MNKIIFNGTELDGYTIEIKETAVVIKPPVDKPPVDVVRPPVAGNQVLTYKSDYPTWARGGSPNTSGSPRINYPAKTELAIGFNASDLLDSSGLVGNFSVYESSNMILGISIAPFLVEAEGGVNPTITAISGKDGIKFAAWNHPATDAQLIASGYKRLPKGDRLYVSFIPINDQPLSFTPLYGY